MKIWVFISRNGLSHLPLARDGGDISGNLKDIFLNEKIENVWIQIPTEFHW